MELAEPEVGKRTILTVPIKAILRYWNPLGDCAWAIERNITPEDVYSYSGPEITDDEFEPEQLGISDRDFEIGRIAYFIRNGIPDVTVDPNPIILSVIELGYITDGNHRLTAAMFRGDETIDVAVVGDLQLAIDVYIHGDDLVRRLYGASSER